MARILVAEDDVDLRSLVAFKLASRGHDVVQVDDGVAALASVRSRRPDVAVLDVTMPGVSGLDAARQIREDPDLADLPIIMLSARAGTSDVEAGLQSGADDYVIKPFSPREFALRVEGLLEQRE
jgi:two-component system, OmpR family, response regulator MtrA